MFIVSLQGLMILLQNLPTMHWGNEEVSVLLAEAYRLKFAFADAPNHYKRWWECRLLPPPVLGPPHGGTILFPTPTPHFQWAFQLRDSVRTCGVASWSDNEPFCNISVWSALFFSFFCWCGISNCTPKKMFHYIIFYFHSCFGRGQIRHSYRFWRKPASPLTPAGKPLFFQELTWREQQKKKEAALQEGHMKLNSHQERV